MNISKHIAATLLLALACAGVLRAQTTTSPYSMYGYGLLRDGATSMQRQMGGIGIAMHTGRQVNAMNPASYAWTDSLTFLWDIGADLCLNWRSELKTDGGERKGHGVGGGLDYVTMQFPVSKYIGMSIGLIPYSSVGYSFGDQVMHGSLSNQGTGGINQAYIGIGGRVAGFSLGANVSYDFGNVINDTYAYTTTGNQTLFEHVIQVRDFNINLGAQYTAKLTRFSRLTLGLTYTPKKSLHGKSWAAYWDITAESAADTVGYTKLAGKYYRPTALGAGINYTRERTSRLMVEADFSWQNWSKADFPALYDDDGQAVVLAQKFNDRLRFALGGEIVPKLRGNYVQRMTYRLGAAYARDYLRIGDNSLREFTLAGGFGFPTAEGKTVVNLGFEWVHRQASPRALIKENYFNITLGLNFNETWFFKRKIK